MRSGGRLGAICTCVLLLNGLFSSQRTEAMPAEIKLRTIHGIDNLQRVEDTCWWWGTRWQYGWRGYGWYPCWDWPKPLPNVIAPEAVPDSALTRPPCVKRWRDGAGIWHAQNTC
jgi:hypothetical protein